MSGMCFNNTNARNVRELRNVLQRALVLSGGNIQREHIQFTIESAASFWIHHKA